ncbi:MAG: Fe-S cluster assembly protein SufD [Thiohalocapsa sp.]|jgi:Fe-S cluster assembly protein SufD|uniref:Fe-S cluster assembly protein SufD n=1 Tax=Thiohalocapsa sp. TaxID=2497641 RepID=UPI0025F86F01|nr:Fe-S cluster assembly protein SufD [Thiohalocapsa sp.]MCG6941730.1 Fe-S cluster assembly protein SufD [Thiohalocapsa sp.]
MSAQALESDRATNAVGGVPEAGPFDAWLPASAPATGEPGWLTAARTAATERVRTQGVPTGKSEGWRYTGLRALLEQGFTPVDEPLDAMLREDLDDLLVPGLDAHRVVVVNGSFAPHLSDLDDLPKGLRIGGLRATLAEDPDALADDLARIAGDGAHVFASLNTAGMGDGVVLLADRGALVEKPVELLHLSVGMDEPKVAQPRHVIRLGDGARVTLIERWASLGDALYCNNAVLEIGLGRDAVLAHRRVQLESPSAFHLSGVYLRQGAGSRYDGINVGLGGRWARTDLVVRFAGEHAECDLSGLYLAGDKQLIDYHLDVQHGLPRCTSRENFKGIVHGKGKAVFDGLVYVAKDAQQTDAAMSNRNLLLSQGAEVDTKPRLEIYADDVKCSHGTTVGQIEPEMLFYLRSRGIPEGLARRMLCLGFAGEIINALGNEALAGYVSEAVGGRLQAAPL